MKIKALCTVSFFAAAMAITTPVAAQDAVEWSATVDAVTEYNFRGFGLGAESLQAGLEASVSGFTFGIWASTGIGQESLVNADEIDLYAGYAFDITETVSADLGATLYHYPQAGDLFDIGTDAGDASTVEIYGGLAFAVTFDPSVYLYYDTTLETWTAEGSAGYSWATGDNTSIDLSGTIGTVEPDQGEGYSYGIASASYNYAFNDATSVYAGLNASTSSEDTFVNFTDALKFANGTSGTIGVDSSTVWAGVGLSTGF